MEGFCPDTQEGMRKRQGLRSLPETLLPAEKLGLFDFPATFYLY
jgi:hypothetical protein